MLLAASYGDHWRNLRLEILSTHRLNFFLEIRNDETLKLLRNLAMASNNKKDLTKVEFRSMLEDLTFNIIMRMVCVKRYYGEENEGTIAEEANKFRDIMNEMAQFGLGSNLGDFVPVFEMVRFGWWPQEATKNWGEEDALFQGLINEHRNKNENSNTTMYLQNLISETLRLHPPAPLLQPHFSSEDCTVRGFGVARNTILFVNAWTIHGDPELRTDPKCFKPERFENGPIDTHKLMPFGLGRRACPGGGMAPRTLGLTLVSLIQCF
ncbi:hypothetical protein JHK82_030126 [Glycine max]|nr:hypothetical protein JHK82_030126 [Glycine max]KAH1223716.1 Cytochrome P450 81D1 [Glycine max]